MRRGWVIGIILTVVLLGIVWYINPFDSTNKVVGNCASVGQIALNEVTGEIKQCCSGLKEIGEIPEYAEPIFYENLTNGDCQAYLASGGKSCLNVPYFGEGYSSICSDCGNGVCEKWENKNNCPVDCS